MNHVALVSYYNHKNSSNVAKRNKRLTVTVQAQQEPSYRSLRLKKSLQQTQPLSMIYNGRIRKIQIVLQKYNRKTLSLKKDFFKPINIIEKISSTFLINNTTYGNLIIVMSTPMLMARVSCCTTSSLESYHLPS